MSFKYKMGKICKIFQQFNVRWAGEWKKRDELKEEDVPRYPFRSSSIRRNLVKSCVIIFQTKKEP